jgi:sn-glycerol 3-phosphate transport system ATP-binding protein
LPAPAPHAGPLTLGLRPEHAEWREGDPGANWPLRVEMLEMLGAERLVYGRLGALPFTLRIDATLAPPQPGQTMALRALPQRLHWFDAGNGQRVA